MKIIHNNRQVVNRIKAFFLLLVLGVFTYSSGLAQSANTEYFMKSSYTKTSLNPALRPDRGHIGVPGLSNIYVDYKTNSFNLDHFLFPGVGENGKTGTFLHPNVSYDTFMKGIAENNYMDLNANVTLLDFGMYVNDLYMFFDASLRTNVNGNIPEDVFSFVKKGVTLQNDEGDQYDFSNVAADMNAYMQLGFGASYPFLDNSLILGAKAKILLGIANSRFRLNKMHLNVGRDEWTLESQAMMQVIYHDVQPTYDEDGYFDGVDVGSGFGFSGFGLGLDLGATFEPGKMWMLDGAYDFMNNLTVSTSFTDIGFISWKKKGMYLETANTQMNITGNHTISFEDDSDNSLENVIDNIGDDFQEAINLREGDLNDLKTTTGLRMKMNWALEYALLRDQLNIGLLSSTYFNPNKTLTEFTLGSSYKPIKQIELGLSYSFIYSKFKTFGFAVHLNPGNAFNFFMASDYVIPHINGESIPTTSRGINMQIGMAVGLGQMNPGR